RADKFRRGAARPEKVQISAAIFLAHQESQGAGMAARYPEDVERADVVVSERRDKGEIVPGLDCFVSRRRDQAQVDRVTHPLQDFVRPGDVKQVDILVDRDPDDHAAFPAYEIITRSKIARPRQIGAASRFCSPECCKLEYIVRDTTTIMCSRDGN